MIHTLETGDTTNRKRDDLFARIATDIENKGYSVNTGALPLHLGNNLNQNLHAMSGQKFIPAGIGRDIQHVRNDSVRSDEIFWITGESEAGNDWLQWVAQMQAYLNRRLFLGLFSFESHFSHYAADDFYKRHVDAFKGEANRVLSLIVYLNSDWKQSDGGELVLFTNKNDSEGIKVTPNFGTMVVFLSEDFPHEVLTTHRDRYSIAGWFRVNASTTESVQAPNDWC